MLIAASHRPDLSEHVRSTLPSVLAWLSDRYQHKCGTQAMMMFARDQSKGVYV